jgi:hypothetical protein
MPEQHSMRAVPDTDWEDARDESSVSSLDRRAVGCYGSRFMFLVTYAMSGWRSTYCGRNVVAIDRQHDVLNVARLPKRPIPAEPDEPA